MIETHSNNKGVGFVEDSGVIMMVMMIMITAMAIMSLKHPFLYNTWYVLICKALL